MATGIALGSQTSLREANRARVVETVKRFGAITQVELAEATGLSAGTISTIVKELQSAGIVDTSPTSRSGRRAVQVKLAHRPGLVAGAHFSRRMLRVALADLTGAVVAEQHLPLAKDHRADTGLDRAAMLIFDMLEHLGAKGSELLGIGVGVGAPIDRATGKVSSPQLMRGWDGVPIAEALAKRTNAPVAVDNDANLAALAEARFGAGQGFDPIVYVSASYGIGAGILVNGEIFGGYSGLAGEIGHISVDEQGPICHCGNRGCLEMLAGSAAMLESLRLTHGNLSLRDLIAQANAGDIACRRVLADAAHYYGIALASLCNLLDPQRVILGGEIAETGDLFLGPLRDFTARFTLPGLSSTIEIVSGTLGVRAELFGALTRALDSVAVVGESEGMEIRATA